MASYVTNRGKRVDLSRLLSENEKSIAVGGGQWMNARGDYITVGGKVTKSKEQLEKEWNDYQERINGKGPNEQTLAMSSLPPGQKHRVPTGSQGAVKNPFKKKWSSRAEMIEDRKKQAPKVKGQKAEKIIEEAVENPEKQVKDLSSGSTEYRRKLITDTDKNDDGAL